MTEIEIKNSIDPLLKDLSEYKNLESAEALISKLTELLGLKTEDRYLLNIPRVDAELTRFELAPGFAKQPSAFGINHNKEDLIDLKLFWVKKTTKTNLSWLVGLTPNYEDSPANDFDKVGIDFVIPEQANSLIILLSNRFKIRSLEIHDFLTPTQAEIFKSWSLFKDNEITNRIELKEYIHNHLWSSFNFEPINRRFYLDLIESFSLLVHSLEPIVGKKPSVMFTTRLIGRLLFIWFLKKKKLINEDFNYFHIEDLNDQLAFYKEKLEILFFETLNKQVDERKHGDKLTPYLNGGLFDISSNDFYESKNLEFPEAFFNQLFNTLNKYNFTVDESSPEFQHVAVDPEMLGRIFESLLAEELDESTGNTKKKSTGAFYTPREIVSLMCEESIIQFLKDKIPYTNDRDRRIEELIRLPESIFRDQDQNKRRDWKPYSEAILSALNGANGNDLITILDPAVGSGAFPMGMLHLLVKIITRLDVKSEKNISNLKRSILAKSLYGVDIEQTAIEICRLRAWLSIIVDIPESEQVDPLPNLDFKFVCANTLFPLDNPHQNSLFDDNQLKESLINIRNDYYKTNVKSKKIKLQNEYTNLTSNSGLFDSKKTQQLKSYHPFDIGSSAGFYDPDLMSGIEKFDIVIGNPPYIDSESMVKQGLELERAFISSHYELATGNWDIYIAFFERGFSLVKENGTLIFITPDIWLSKSYGQKLRKTFLPNLRKIIKLGRDVFETADLSSVITILEKKEIQMLKSGSFLDSGYININEFDKSTIKEPFNLDFIFSENIKFISKLENVGGQIKDKATCENACSTADCYLLKDLLEEFTDDKNMEDYYRVVNSGTLDKYLNKWGSKEMTYLKSKYKKPIVSRERFSSVFRNSYLTKTKLPKIIFKGLRKLDGSLDLIGDTIPGKSTLIVKSEDSDALKILSGVLNSSLVIFYLQEKYSASTYQGALTFTKDMINELPFPSKDSPYKIKILKYIDLILESNNLEVVVGLHKSIDICTFLLYGFSYEEVGEYFPNLVGYSKFDFESQIAKG